MVLFRLCCSKTCSNKLGETVFFACESISACFSPAPHFRLEAQARAWKYFAGTEDARLENIHVLNAHEPPITTLTQRQCTTLRRQTPENCSYLCWRACPPLSSRLVHLQLYSLCSHHFYGNESTFSLRILLREAMAGSLYFHGMRNERAS